MKIDELVKLIEAKVRERPKMLDAAGEGASVLRIEVWRRRGREPEVQIHVGTLDR